MAYDLDHCKVCKKELNEGLKEFAHRRCEEVTCNTVKCTRADIINRFGCCKKAKLTPCVCMYSFKCPKHGERHIGTHD